MKFSIGARIATGVAGLLVAVYVLTSMAFAAPGGAFKAATEPLRDLGRPYFSQSWNVFAPNILKANIEMEIAAQWIDESGELVKSDWVGVTDLELAAVAGSPLPSRAIKQSWNLISAYNRRYLALNEEQRDYVQDTFIDRAGGDGGFEARTEEELFDDLLALGDDRGEVFSLLRYDYLVKEYATYMATAYFDERITRVRWRLVYNWPNSFENRHSEVPERRDTWRAFGWRYADDRIDPAELQAFERLIERAGGGAEAGDE